MGSRFQPIQRGKLGSGTPLAATPAARNLWSRAPPSSFFPWALSRFGLGRAAQRVTVLSSKIHHLLGLRFGDVTGERVHDPVPFAVYVQHDVLRLGDVLAEE